HRAHHLLGQDLDGAVHARAAAGYEPVEVGATDQGEARAEGHGGHDVRAVHDAGVDADLGVGTDLARDLGQQMERDRGTIELAPAVVGQDDPVHAQVGERLGDLERLDPLDHELAGPYAADDLEVLEADGGIHRGVQQFAHGAAGRGQRGELEGGRGEEVEPPPGPRDCVQHGAGRQL